MRLEYDKEADAIYIKLSDMPYAYGKDLDDLRRIDYDADVGIYEDPNVWVEHKI